MKPVYFARLTISISLLVASLPLVGCQSREDVLYAYGTLAFVAFIAVTSSSVALHCCHSRPWFQQTRVWSRKLILPLSYIAIPAGAIISLVSLGAEGTMRLGVFVGVLIAVLFYSLQQWGKAEAVEKQRLYIKIAQISLSFLVVLVFLCLGGKGLK